MPCKFTNTPRPGSRAGVVVASIWSRDINKIIPTSDFYLTPTQCVFVWGTSILSMSKM